MTEFVLSAYRSQILRLLMVNFLLARIWGVACCLNLANCTTGFLSLISFNGSSGSTSVLILIKLVCSSLLVLKINVLLDPVLLNSGLLFIDFSDKATRSSIKYARRVLFPALGKFHLSVGRDWALPVLGHWSRSNAAFSLLSCKV